MRFRYGLVLVAAALSLTACGGGDDPGGDGVASLNGSTGQGSQAPAAADDEFTQDEQLAFARCMRDNGVDMPDPVDGKIAIEAGGGAEDMAKAEKANEACRHLLPNGGVPQPPTPEELDKMRKMAQCFRDNGIDVPDPDPQNPGMALPDIGPDDPKMQKAMEACAGDGMPAMRAVPAK
ncbi:hypothetical protein ACPZ19_25280 [Amycolatopsis lurida]